MGWNIKDDVIKRKCHGKASEIRKKHGKPIFCNDNRDEENDEENDDDDDDDDDDGLPDHTRVTAIPKVLIRVIEQYVLHFSRQWIHGFQVLQQPFARMIRTILEIGRYALVK